MSCLRALAIKLTSDGDDALNTCLVCRSTALLSLWNNFNSFIVHLSALIAVVQQLAVHEALLADPVESLRASNILLVRENPLTTGNRFLPQHRKAFHWWSTRLFTFVLHLFLSSSLFASFVSSVSGVPFPLTYHRHSCCSADTWQYLPGGIHILFLFRHRATCHSSKTTGGENNLRRN